MEITCYNDFASALLQAGFSFANGGNNEGVFGLLKFGWDNQPPDSPIQWHYDEDYKYLKKVRRYL